MVGMKQKKVLIITVPFGGGHYATAAKIADLLQERDRSLDVEILDVVTDGWPAFAKRSSNAYQSSTAASNGFWFRIYYVLSDHFPRPLRWFASAAFNTYARKKLAEIAPDLVIATFPFLGHVAVRARAATGSTAPIVTVVTDAGRVQGIWLDGAEDAILTATADTVDYAIQRHMAAERIRFVGFPVSKAFYELPSKHEARTSLGLNPSVFTLLWTSGGYGMSADKSLGLLKRVAQLDLPLQIICVAGKNQQLETELRAIDFPANITPYILGFTDQMPKLMAAADVVVSKSGWLTISEAIAAQRPLFLFDAIPGHEEQNAQYVTTMNFGVYEPNPAVMAQLISTAISDPETLAPRLTALARAHDPAVRRRLVDYLVGLLR